MPGRRHRTLKHCSTNSSPTEFVISRSENHEASKTARSPMDKRPDFGSDLSEISSDVSREVSDVLNAVKQKRANKLNTTKTIEIESAPKNNAAPAATVPES